MLVGNVVALLSPLIYIPVLTYCPPFKPQNYDWVSMARIDSSNDEPSVDSDPERLQTDTPNPNTADRAQDRTQLDRAAKFARILCVSLALCFIILWPMPMFGSGYIFSKGFYTGWITVGIIWLFCSSGVVVFLPLWESRKTIKNTLSSVGRDMAGKGRVTREPETMHGEVVDSSVSPPPEPEKLRDEK